MKYALLIYDTAEAWANLSDEERAQTFGEYEAIARAPGVYGGDQLQPIQTATTVRVADGETLVSDGPFPEMKEFFGGYYLVEAKEHLGGYYVVDADDLDAALEIAARIPAARMGGAVEVRPLVER